ncbi:hypothetical protein MSMTP_1491 [Methanosarcina sp. MTP4]|uniref:hypothetical protein n=1 Tax=Methanosarcina sp. MTP4 TaxID=1434100 RepID=UPI000615589E|nr:hypothetical protein [Methanosarcina sp. MTP4]AKB24960.1 hypothetical protein MSMTP_1491 [Methanosarcina sp. MTP4]
MINAVVHTDYSQKGAPIRVAFFDDRIEIEKSESKHNLKLPGSTPGCLSIDFCSRQPKELRDRNCYVIRTGKGNFAIFNKTGSGRLSE